MDGIVSEKHFGIREADPSPDKIFAAFLHRWARPPIRGMRSDGLDGVYNILGRERTTLQAFRDAALLERLVRRCPFAFVKKILLHRQKVRIEKDARMKRTHQSEKSRDGGCKADVRPVFHRIDTFIPTIGSQHW